jgi:hypothetical protein
MRSWGLSADEQDEVWQRWRRGESLRLIARRLGKRGPSVRAFGYRPAECSARRRVGQPGPCCWRSGKRSPAVLRPVTPAA